MDLKTRSQYKKNGYFPYIFFAPKPFSLSWGNICPLPVSTRVKEVCQSQVHERGVQKEMLFYFGIQQYVLM